MNSLVLTPGFLQSRYSTTKATIQRWGNSLAVRLPKPVADEASLSQGSEVELKLDGKRIVLVPRPRAKRYELGKLLAGVTDQNRHDVDPFGAPCGKEIW